MKYNSRLQIFLLNLLLLITFASCQQTQTDDTETGPRQPNVVMIFLDDGAFDDFRPFGEPRYPTPHVNTLAEEGRSFYNFYVPHSMPHVPIFCSDKFEGRSGTGLYGDVMMELDWSVGQINQAIKDNVIDAYPEIADELVEYAKLHQDRFYAE